MGKSRFIELMAKSMDGSASEAELKELEVFLQKYPQYKKMQQVTQALESSIQQPGTPLQEADINNKLDALWADIKNAAPADAMPVRERRLININSYKKWAATAAAVLIIGLGSLLFYKSHKLVSTPLLSTANKYVYVPYGKRVKVTLADGTIVNLNAGSHFSYPEKFADTQRDVTLDGEGFFEVTKDARKPFLVHTAGLTVRVLGTVFNVRAYKEDKKTETTLFKGKVQVELKDDPEKKIILAPHEKLTVSNNLVQARQVNKLAKEVAKLKYEVSVLPVVDNEEYQENAWLENKLLFINTDFEDVAVSMERKFRVHIVFEDEALKKEQLSGVLKDENLESALVILKQITTFQSTVSGDTVYISRLNK